MSLLSGKVLAITFGLAALGFMVATVILAVDNSKLRNDLQDALDKLNLISTASTTQSAPPMSTASTESTAPSSSTNPTGSTAGTTSSTSTPSPGSTVTESTTSVNSTDTTEPSVWPTLTTPHDGPTKPTLPPGLPNPEDFIHRLPTDIVPINYDIYWYPNLRTNLCAGTVSIKIRPYNETNLIILHAVDLEIEGISLLHMIARVRIPVKSFRLDAEREMLIIELDQVLEVLTFYILSISFTSKMEGFRGIYASSYWNEENESRWIATSKFEPTYARQAFPCFDEPAMKATFEITVVRPTGDGYHVLSNMDVLKEEELGNLTEVRFRESVPMSTYLACFIVSDFVKKSRTVRGMLEGASDFPMSVYAPSGQVNKVDYALDIAGNITEYYINYFQIAYPLPKLDLAAIPDFVSGAMEHWGLVTFRETALLYDESSSSSANKQRVATVLAHELAHMWFGNLVTMKWWDNLWLNEGFASYIEYKGVDYVHPNWHMMDQFLIEDLHGVMKLDATLASHPIVQPVENPNQITELFDSITYSKGASVIRMLEELVTEEKFRTATTNYLNKFSLSNAETDDFLTEIEMLGLPFDVKVIMQTWTMQMGLPVVEVVRTEGGYKCTQKRFLSNPEDYNKNFEVSQFNYRWSIPITFYTNENSELQHVIFNYNDNELPLNIPTSVDWIKLNKDQIGYYHVNYPLDIWDAIIKKLIEYRFTYSVADRASLLSDAFILSGASQLPISVALNISKYLENETDYVPWSVGSSHLNNIKNLLYYTELYGDFSRYGRKLVTKAYEEVTWTSDMDHLTNRLRSTILNTACAFGHDDALEEALRRFRSWLDNPEVRPNPDIRWTVYYYGMQMAGNEKIWDQTWQLYKKEQDAQEKIKLMEALAAIKEPWILQRYINLAWDEENVRGQDYFSCLQYISRNPIGQSLVWEYVREQWPRMVERFGINERYLGRLIPGITNRFASQTKLDEMEAFFAKYPEAGAGTAARREALETVKYNIKWLQENKQQVQTWLAELNAAENNSSL